MTPRRLLGYALVLLVGVAGGFALGLPAMVERAGQSALARLEDRLEVQVRAERVDWSLAGDVVVEGLTVIDRWAPAAEAPLLVARRVAIQGDVSLVRRRVRLERVALEGVDVHAVWRRRGDHNLARVVRGLREIFSPGAGSGSAGGGLGLVERALPEITMTDATVRVDAPIPPLPLGLEVPARITFAGGALRLVPDGEGADAGATLTGEFTDTSLDPGHGLGVEVSAFLDGRPRALGVRFDRPVRFYLGQRVAGVRAVRWDPEGLALGQLQLSVPLDPATRYDSVGAAATVERLYVTPEPRELLRRVGGPPPAEDVLGPWLERAVGALDSVEITAPAVVARVDGNGRHSFEDLWPALAEPAASPVVAVDGDLGRDEAGLVALLTDASLAASERLTQGAARRADGPSLRRRFIEHLTGMEARANGLAAAVAASLARLPVDSLRVTDARLDLLVERTRVNVEGLGFEAQRGPEGVAIDAVAVVPDVTRRPAKLSARLAPDASVLTVDAAVAGLPLPVVAGVVPRPLVSEVSDGVLHDSRVSFTWREGGAQINAKASIEVTDAVVKAPALASEPLRIRDAGVAFDVALARDEARVSLTGGRLSFGDVAIAFDAQVEDFRRKPRLTLHAALAETPVQAIVDALPRAMMSRLDGLTVAGTLAWDLTVKLDTVDVDALEIDSRPALRGFAVQSMGQHVDFDLLRRAFSYPIRRADGSPGRRYSGPLSAGWVPLEEISPYLPKAVTTTEDGSFYRHDGLSTFAIRESIITNLKQGRFARGASTITQQLVKNLFLGPQKTVARKLQELFIAWQLDKAFTKDEIMALYLNVIEFGPGIYGVRDAAQHWFGKAPSELTPLEAIFLSSVIPNPRRYHRFFEQGRVSPRWRHYLRALLSIMVERGKISQAEADAQAPYDPLFRGQVRAPAAGAVDDLPLPD